MICFLIKYTALVSTHSRPKAAEGNAMTPRAGHDVSTHSRPKAAAKSVYDAVLDWVFQHTAARRRLLRPEVTGGTGSIVSTHSRPKAAVKP